MTIKKFLAETPELEKILQDYVNEVSEAKTYPESLECRYALAARLNDAVQNAGLLPPSVKQMKQEWYTEVENRTGQTWGSAVR